MNIFKTNGLVVFDTFRNCSMYVVWKWTKQAQLNTVRVIFCGQRGSKYPRTQGVKEFPPALHPHPLLGVAPRGATGEEWQDFFSVVAEADDVVFAVYCGDPQTFNPNALEHRIHSKWDPQDKSSELACAACFEGRAWPAC